MRRIPEPGGVLRHRSLEICGRISKTAPDDRRPMAAGASAPGPLGSLPAPRIPIGPRISAEAAGPRSRPKEGAGQSDQAAFGGAGEAGLLGDLAAGDQEMIVGCRGTLGAGEWQISEIRAVAVWF